MSNVASITPQPRVPALRGGGNVTAIIPQSIEDVFRVAKGVAQSGLAPAALVGNKDENAAAMAIAVAIMSGAELGLKPMVALRSFTVINGKPALYGDGLINVVRQSGKVEYLRTGCDDRDGEMVGWCEAKRNDTDEDKRVEFTQAQAQRADLWKTSGNTPWAKYPERMLAWRAAGYCLRELFGDVLGGIRDEFEAREIADAEFEEVQAAPKPPTPPSPPSPPSNDETEAVEPEAVTGVHFDLESFLAELEEVLAGASDEETVEEVWDSFDVESTLTDDEDALGRASKLKHARLEQVAA